MDTTQAQFSYFTPDEAVHLQLQAIGGPNSSGMGILEVPPPFTSPATQHRIRVTMLHSMGSLAPGHLLDAAKSDFMIKFRGALTPMTLALFNAEWDYLASIREALHEGLTKTLGSEPERVLIETVTLMRAFVDIYHKKGERMDFEMFRAYVIGYADDSILRWFRAIWDGLRFDKRQTFIRRLLTIRTFVKLPRSPT